MLLRFVGCDCCFCTRQETDYKTPDHLFLLLIESSRTFYELINFVLLLKTSFVLSRLAVYPRQAANHRRGKAGGREGRAVREGLCFGSRFPRLVRGRRGVRHASRRSQVILKKKKKKKRGAGRAQFVRTDRDTVDCSDRTYPTACVSAQVAIRLSLDAVYISPL